MQETWDGEQNYMKVMLEINLEILDIFNEVHVLVHPSVYVQERVEGHVPVVNLVLENFESYKGGILVCWV